jgi:hypothetical protein
MAFELARDERGLKEALLSLFEESLAFSRMESALNTSGDDDRERMVRSLPERTLSPGFYRVGEYLLWLDRHLRLQVPCERMQAFEAEGLCILAQARAEFERNHPPCHKCGELQDGRFALMCWSCGTEFKR